MHALWSEGVQRMEEIWTTRPVYHVAGLSVHTMLSRTLTLWNLSEGLAQDHSLKGQRHLSAPRHYVGGPCGGYVR